MRVRLAVCSTSLRPGGRALCAAAYARMLVARCDIEASVSDCVCARPPNARHKLTIELVIVMNRMETPVPSALRILRRRSWSVLGCTAPTAPWTAKPRRG